MFSKFLGSYGTDPLKIRVENLGLGTVGFLILKKKEKKKKVQTIIVRFRGNFRIL